MRFLILIYLVMAISCIKDQAIDLCNDPNSYCGGTGANFCQTVVLDSVFKFQVTAEDVDGVNIYAGAGEFNDSVSGTNNGLAANKLIDGTAMFTTDGLRNQFIVANITTNEQTIGNVDNDIQISLADDIFTGTGETYAILNWFGFADFGPPIVTNVWWEYVPLYGDNQLKYLDTAGFVGGFAGPQILNLNSAYRVVFTVRDYVSGSVTCGIGTSSTFLTVSANGTYEVSGVPFGGDQVGFTFAPFSCMTFDDVEVYEICRVGVKVSQSAGGTAIYTNEEFNDGTGNPFANSPIYYLNQSVQFEMNLNDLIGTPGCYFIRVYCIDDPSTFIETKCLNVSENPDCAVKLEWENNEDIGGLIYTYRTFNQVLYVLGEFRNPHFALPNENYKFSNGDTQLLSASRTTINTLGVREIPSYLHHAIASGLVLDTFNVNDVQYRLVGEGYDPAYRRSSQLAPVFIELQPKVEDYKNNLC